MAEARRPTQQDRNETHVRTAQERDYEREDRFQKNPQGRLSKKTASSSTSAPKAPARSAATTRRGR